MAAIGLSFSHRSRNCQTHCATHTVPRVSLCTESTNTCIPRCLKACSANSWIIFAPEVSADLKPSISVIRPVKTGIDSLLLDGIGRLPVGPFPRLFLQFGLFLLTQLIPYPTDTLLILCKVFLCPRLSTRQEPNLPLNVSPSQVCQYRLG